MFEPNSSLYMGILIAYVLIHAIDMHAHYTSRAIGPNIGVSLCLLQYIMKALVRL